MLDYLRTLVSRRNAEDGASAVEYALLVALIAAIIVVAVYSLGGLVKSTFDKTCTSIKSNGSVSASCTS